MNTRLLQTSGNNRVKGLWINATSMKLSAAANLTFVELQDDDRDVTK